MSVARTARRADYEHRADTRIASTAVSSGVERQETGARKHSSPARAWLLRRSETRWRTGRAGRRRWRSTWTAKPQPQGAAPELIPLRDENSHISSLHKRSFLVVVKDSSDSAAYGDVPRELLQGIAEGGVWSSRSTLWSTVVPAVCK